MTDRLTDLALRIAATIANCDGCDEPLAGKKRHIAIEADGSYWVHCPACHSAATEAGEGDARDKITDR